MNRLIATKTTLLAHKRFLKLAKEGYELLEKKREVLLREFIQTAVKLDILYKEFAADLKAYYEKFASGIESVGEYNRKLLANENRSYLELKPFYYSVMGVQVANLDYSYHQPFDPGPGLSTYEMDKALAGREKLQKTLVMFIELMIKLNRLGLDIKKTQRRVNALELFLIPKYEGEVAWISSVIEEHERQAIVVQKHVKKRLNRG